MIIKYRPTNHVEYGKGILVFLCQHEADPKGKDKPILPSSVCDFFEAKLPCIGYPAVCFNCKHSYAYEIELEGE
jgi:hypothetical protein